MLINENDILVLKKPHACGSNKFIALKTGADIKMKCLKCSHVISLDLDKLLKRLKYKEDKDGKKEI